MSIFGTVSILAVISFIIGGYRFIKVSEDFVTIWSQHKGKMVVGIAITLFTLGVNITLYDGWFVITWSIIWINLVIWFRSVRYIPIFILRYAIICVPFTLAIDAILFDTILDEASADLMAGGLDAEEPSNLHAVDPHEVSGYETEDGTMVEGYYRDGDGNTDINLSKEDGGGYLRSNPDGDPSHNLHS